MFKKLLLVSVGITGLMVAESLIAEAPAFASVCDDCSPPPYTSTGDVQVGSTTTYVGNSGTGTLTITGVLTTSRLIAGNQVAGNGTVIIISGGTLNDDAIVGNSGTAVMSNTGAHTVTGNLILGNQSTGNGTYTITGSSAQTTVNFAGATGSTPPETPNGALIVGNAGVGTFMHGTGSDTPTVAVAGDLALGLQSGSTGTYTIKSGTLTVGGAMLVGEASTNANLFTQSGGTVTITGTAVSDSRYAPVLAGSSTYPGTLYVGAASVSDNGVGTYAMTGGTLDAQNIVLGFAGVGTLNQSGGQVTTGSIDMGDCGGCNGGNAAGFYNLNGTGALTSNGITVGSFGHAEFTQGADDNGNTVNTVNGTLAIGNGATATPNVANPGNYDRSGTYTLDSGTLNAQTELVGNVGTGTLIQNSGTNNVSGYVDVGVQYTTPSGSGPGTPSDPVFGGAAVGTYTMNGGQLNIGGDSTQPQFGSAASGGVGLIVGDAGTGTFNQIAGNVTSGTPQIGEGCGAGCNSPGVEGDIVIGAQSTGQGTYNLGDPTAQTPGLTVNGSIIIGRDAGSNAGTTPGASPTNPNLVIQGDGTSLGVYYNGGSSNANPLGSDIMVGLNGNGAVTQKDNSTVYMDGDLSIGINHGAVGSYTLSATSNGGNLQVGNFLNVGGVGEFVNGVSEQTTATGGTGYFTQTSGDVTVVQDVDIGNNGGTGTYTMSGGTLTAGGITYLGNTGTGTVTQTGGTFETGYLDIGTGSTVGNSFTLSNGTVTVDQDLVVGNFATGAGTNSFTQIGGTVNVNSGGYGVYLNNGTYDLQSGNFNVANSVTVGDAAGGASFTQEGGAASIGNTLIIGNSASVSGTYTLSGGSLTTGITHGSSIGDVVIGSSGTGELDNSGGIQTSESTAGLTLGFFGGSQGTYKLTGTGSLSVAGNENVGVFGTGIFQQGDGSGATSNTVGGSLYISSGFGGPASSYTLTDGTLTVTGSEVVGFAAQGSFTQSGGTNNANGGLTVGLLSNAPTDATQFGNGTYTLGGSGTLNVGDDLVLGSGTGTSGTFNHNTASGDAGLLSFTGSGQNLVVGDAGTGVFNEGSATHTTDLNLQTSSTTLDIGRSVGGNGTFNLAAGSSLEDDAIVGDAGSGTFNNTGGTHTVGTSSAPANLVLGNQSTGNGTYNSSNGGNNTVNGNLVVGGAGTGIYNLGNGTTGADLQVQGSGLSDGNVFVGETGTGTITASSGSVATIAGGLILGGPSPGETTGNGTLTVTGFRTEWTNEGQTQIGGAGTGTLNVLAGGYFESHTGGSGSGSAAALGSVAGSTGTATVDGTNSEWNMPDGALRVGVSSTGSGNGAQGNLLTISNGGEVIDNAGNGGDGALTDDGAAASVGWKSGSVGTVNVVTGGTWSNSGDLVIGDAGTGTVHVDNSSGSGIAVGGNLILGNLVSGNGTLNLDNGGALNLNGGTQFIVGNAGTGVVNQTDGDLNLTAAGVTLEIGAQGGSTGTYNLTGGSLKDDLIVGDAGTGTFNNTGMTHTVTGSLTLGNQSTGNGTYNLTDGGTTTVSSFTTVGAAGTGTFLNDASTHNTQDLVIGQQGTSSGNLYTLRDGGSLNVGQSSSPGFTDVAEHGSGTFTQTSGTTTIIGDIDIGRCGGTGCNGVGDTDAGVGNGTVNLQGGSMTVSSFAVVGDSGTGAFTQSGAATMTVDGTLTVGRGESNGGGPITGSGTYTLGGSGSLSVGGDLVLGSQTGTSGTFNDNTASGDAATLSFTGSSQNLVVGDAGVGIFNEGSSSNTTDLNLQNSGTTLDIGRSAGGNGTFNLAAGSSLEDDVIVGDAGTGTFNNNAGSNAVSGNLVLGNQATGNGTYNLTGAGTLTVSGDAEIGNAGIGVYAQTGGTATITGTMTINNNASSSASISGGMLTASAIVNNSTLTLNGGTVDAPITNYATTQTNSGNTMTVNGAAINNGTWTVSAGSTLNQSGGFTNNGTVDVSSSTAHWTGTFTNNGAYHSDPSTSYFADLAVGTNGYLTGGAGDVFNISGNFHNTSTQNTLWSTSAATLEFSGSGGTSHTMDLVGLDEGPVSGGFTNNYAWGLLDLDSGNSLSLDGTAGTNALYAAALEGLDISGDDVTNIFGDGLNIYYNPADDAALDDLTYALENGGFLCPIGASTCTVSTSPPPPQVPEPDSLLLLGGGLVGFAFLRRRVARSKGQASPR